VARVVGGDIREGIGVAPFRFHYVCTTVGERYNPSTGDEPGGDRRLS
jgi:hypothetical protein